MNTERQGKTLIQMNQAANGYWNVNEVGAEQPLASFEDIEQCVDYACSIAKEKNGITVQTLN